MVVKRPEATNDLIYEMLKQIQDTLARQSDDLREIKERLGRIAHAFDRIAR